MTLNEYQQRAKTTAIYPEHGTGLYAAITYCTLGLTGEAGEVANKVKKLLRDEDTINMRAKIMKEIGGVLWYAATLADELGANLDSVAQDNLDDLASRKERNALKGEGDVR